MRGSTTRQVTFLSVTTDQLIAPDHPIRRVKPFVEAALAGFRLSRSRSADRARDAQPQRSLPSSSRKVIEPTDMTGDSE